MDEKKNQQPKDWREARRMQAWKLSQKGWKQKDIAEALGVTEGAVSQWLKKARAEGVEGLRHHKGGGPKPRLKVEQVEQLPQLLSQGAESYGYLTTTTVSEAVQRGLLHPECERIFVRNKHQGG